MKLIERFGRFIEPAPDADRQRPFRRDHFANRVQNGTGARHVHQHVAAARFVFDFLDWAGKVQVDRIVSCIVEDAGGGGHGIGLGPDDLARQGMIFIIQIDAAPQPFAAIEKDDIEQRFCDRVTAAAAASHQAHRPIAVPRQTRLAERRGEFDGADVHGIKRSSPQTADSERHLPSTSGERWVN